MERKLIDYLPYVVQEFKEFQGITSGEQPEFDLVWDAHEQVFANQFINTMDNYGLSRWEEILRLVPKATDSLNVRRFRVLSRLNERLPYTLPQLRNILQTLCGKGNFTAEIQTRSYELVVRIDRAAKSNFSDVASLLDKVTPTNLLINLSLWYNTHREIAQFTHAQLGAHTHIYLKNEVLQDGKQNAEL